MSIYYEQTATPIGDHTGLWVKDHFNPFMANLLACVAFIGHAKPAYYQ